MLRARVYIGEMRSEARMGEWMLARTPIVPRSGVASRGPERVAR